MFTLSRSFTWYFFYVNLGFQVECLDIRSTASKISFMSFGLFVRPNKLELTIRWIISRVPGFFWSATIIFLASASISGSFSGLVIGCNPLKTLWVGVWKIWHKKSEIGM